MGHKKARKNVRKESPQSSSCEIQLLRRREEREQKEREEVKKQKREEREEPGG